MREAAFLHYRPGCGFWHRHDPRLKLLELAVWSVLALAGGWPVLGTLLAVLLPLHGISGSRVSRMRRPLVFWLAMAGVIIIAAGLTESDPPLTVAGWESPFGRPGLASGLLRSGRLFTVLLAAQLLAATTDPADLAGAVRRITRWGALATALSLTLAFIPRLFDEALIVRDAAFSRGLGQRRSMLRRATALGMPLAESALRRADLTTEALLSRAYVDDPTPPEMRIGARDILLTAAGLLPPLAVAVLARLAIPG